MTQSITPWTASGMIELNAPLEKPVRDFLQTLVSIPQDHARGELPLLQGKVYIV